MARLKIQKLNNYKNIAKFNTKFKTKFLMHFCHLVDIVR